MAYGQQWLDANVLTMPERTHTGHPDYSCEAMLGDLQYDVCFDLAGFQAYCLMDLFSPSHHCLSAPSGR